MRRESGIGPVGGMCETDPVMSRSCFDRTGLTWSVLLSAVVSVVFVAALSGCASAGSQAPQQTSAERPGHVHKVDAPAGPLGVYVALGSSYASGPDHTRISNNPCLRTPDNYPNQVAKALRMRLIDASCSGATTANIVDVAQRSGGRPQVDAVTPDTALVTITSGGNDINYIGRLLAMSCADVIHRVHPVVAQLTQTCSGRPIPAPPSAAAYDVVRRELVDAVRVVRSRAPGAKVLIVDYPPALVAGEKSCARLPLTVEQAAQTVEIFDKLADATATAAQQSGAQLVRASVAGAAHTVCSADPWLGGFAPPIPYHPNARGKSGVARLVVDELGGPVN